MSLDTSANRRRLWRRISGRIGVLLALGIFGTCAGLVAEPPPDGCTVLTISHSGEVFFGGNDDYDSRDKAYWVDSGGDTGYGAIYFGDPDNVQQGFNEAGLAYDANGLPTSPVAHHAGTRPGPGEYGSYPISILRECANVDEVIEWANEHRWHSSMHDQLHFADASGDAVVISVGANGRLVFTRKPDGNSYLVSTNFNVANPQNGDFPSWRYDLATRRATELVQLDGVSIEQVASIMDAVHVETRRNFTVYTVVADLVRKQVSVYFLFQYDDPIVLDIRSELEKGNIRTSLRNLFPNSTVARGDAALNRLDTISRVWEIIGITWVAAVLICILLWFFVPVIHAGGATSLFAIAALGPPGLLIGLIWTGSTQCEAFEPVDGVRRHGWKASISKAGLDAASAVVPLAACVLLVTTVNVAGNSSAITLLLLIVAPIVFAWQFVHTPVLSHTARVGYVRASAASAVPTFFSCAVLIATALPLLLPTAIWLAVRTDSVVTLISATWAFSVVFCVFGFCLLATIYGVSGFAQSEIETRRFGTTAVMFLAGMFLLVAGIYLSSQTVVLFAPLIDGAA